MSEISNIRGSKKVKEHVCMYCDTQYGVCDCAGYIDYDCDGEDKNCPDYKITEGVEI